MGAHFEALYMGVLMTASYFSCIFFESLPLDLKNMSPSPPLPTLEYQIEDPGRLLFFSQNANRVVDLKQSRLLFFSKNVHRVAIKQSR